LALLEEWKDVEEIAAIADRLGNESVDEQFEELKRRQRDDSRYEGDPLSFWPSC
jgi:hypothetical protein